MFILACLHVCLNSTNTASHCGAFIGLLPSTSAWSSSHNHSFNISSCTMLFENYPQHSLQTPSSTQPHDSTGSRPSWRPITYKAKLNLQGLTSMSSCSDSTSSFKLGHRSFGGFSDTISRGIGRTIHSLLSVASNHALRASVTLASSNPLA